MVLAAVAGDKAGVELVHCAAGSVAGERATVAGIANAQPDAEVNIKKANNVWDAARPLLKTNAECVACFGDQPLQSAAGVAKARSIAGGLVQ